MNPTTQAIVLALACLVLAGPTVSAASSADAQPAALADACFGAPVVEWTLCMVNSVLSEVCYIICGPPQWLD